MARDCIPPARLLPSRAGARSVIIECTSCHSKYQYDEARFEGKPSKKIKCAKCQSIFEIHNPAQNPSSEQTASRHDDTQHRRQAKPLDTTEQSQLPDRSPAAASPQLPTGKRLSLAIIDGNDAGTVVRVERPRFVIGRANADLTINDSEASRQHAALEIRDSVYLLEDLGSTNGTLVDGKKITEMIELTDKSEFVIGGTTLMFIVTDEG
jgi:pSer/pThr/pTyr-binding forkhead associated (FHA) protein